MARPFDTFGSPFVRIRDNVRRFEELVMAESTENAVFARYGP
jgi:hypothetical protein